MKKSIIFKNKFAIIASSIIVLITSTLFLVSINCAKKVPNPIVINTEEDFYSINNNLSGYYVLGETITFSNPIEPIGSPDKPFTGTLDGLNKFQLKNITFDFSQLDYQKFSLHGEAFIGLFSVNKGTIIHNTFTDVHYINLETVDDNNLNFGVVCGSNEGKITSNTFYQPNETIEMGSFNNLCYGTVCGINKRDIRRNRIIGHFNCRLKSSGNLCIGGFSGASVNGAVFEMLQFNGQMYFYNADDVEVVELACGSIVGKMNGGKITNCDVQRVSISQMNKKTQNTFCGGMIGVVDSESARVSISDSVYIATIKTGATNTSCFSSCIGFIKNAFSCSITNVLIGGECSNYYSQPIECNASDAFNSELSVCKLTNCYVLDTYVIQSSAVRRINNIVSIQSISLQKLRWDDSFWSIENGVISLKVF